MKRQLSFRPGSTSYVFEADLPTNARRLAGLVGDVELVLFHTPTRSNLPDKITINALREIARTTGLTYTVHLPRDVAFEPKDISQALARRVIKATRPLSPWGYVVHLDGKALIAEASSSALARWREGARRTVDWLINQVGEARLVCLENVERWPPEAFLPLLDEFPISLCIDITHLWVAGRDPLPYLQAHLARTRVLHLHGIDGDGQDHVSLRHLERERLEPVLQAIVAGGFGGVLTLEVFGQADFFSSYNVLNAYLSELGARLKNTRGDDLIAIL